MLQAKLNEALAAVLPIIAIVLVLSLTVAPMTSGVLLAFLFGGALRFGALSARAPFDQPCDWEIILL